MESAVVCPYCGERISLWIDRSAGRTQHYIEACAVCCRPLNISVATREDGDVRVDRHRQDE
jgi:hypothetical protein